MEVKYIQLYDCLGKGADTIFGKIISERECKNCSWIPTAGNLIRLDSGEYNGIYKVIAVIYNEPTKLIRIKLEKYNTLEMV